MTHVLFWDIDGTLLSTARAGVFALEDAAREVLGRTPDFGQLFTAGLTDWQVAAAAIEAAGEKPKLDTVAAFVSAYEQQLPGRLHMRRGSVLPGVREALDALEPRSDVLLLLLTGNTPAGAAAKLEHYGLARYFAGGAFSADLGDRESVARRGRGLAAQLLGAAPAGERMFVIGDTPYDVRCGKAIGARTVAVATGPHSLEELSANEPWLALEQLPQPSEFCARLQLEPLASWTTAPSLPPPLG